MATAVKEAGPQATDKVCPICGGVLFSGAANGDILVCVEGCSTATDPATLDSPVTAIGPWSVDAEADKAPVVVENTTPPDPNGSLDPYVGPTEVLSSVGVGADTTPLIGESPAPEPTPVLSSVGVGADTTPLVGESLAPKS